MLYFYPTGLLWRELCPTSQNPFCKVVFHAKRKEKNCCGVNCTSSFSVFCFHSSKWRQLRVCVVCNCGVCLFLCMLVCMHLFLQPTLHTAVFQTSRVLWSDLDTHKIFRMNKNILHKHTQGLRCYQDGFPSSQKIKERKKEHYSKVCSHSSGSVSLHLGKEVIKLKVSKQLNITNIICRLKREKKTDWWLLKANIVFLKRYCFLVGWGLFSVEFAYFFCVLWVFLSLSLLLSDIIIGYFSLQ